MPELKVDMKKITKFVNRVDSPTKKWVLMATLIFSIQNGILEDPKWSALFGDPLINELKQLLVAEKE